MTIKLQNLSKWQNLPEGKSLLLQSNVLRRIKLNVNTEAPTSFMALEFGVEYFLGVVTGLETIEFSAEGDVEVSATSAGGVWYWTDDGDVHSHNLGDHRKFIVPMTVQKNTPAMDLLAEKMQAKHDRRMALQAEHNQALWAQIAQERAEHAAALEAAQKPVDDPAPAGGEDAGAPGVTPDAPASGAGEGASGA